jgi:hypothetical protein
MKVSVSDRGIPSQNHIIADANFLFAKQNDTGQITIVSNLNPGSFSQGKVDIIHCAVCANDQRGVDAAAKASKTALIIVDDSIKPNLDIERKS